MNHPNRPLHSRRNQSHQFLEAESLGSNRIDHRTPLLLRGVDQQLRHVLDVNWTNRVAPVPRDPEHGKMPHEPRNIVDEDVFRAEDDSRP